MSKLSAWFTLGSFILVGSLMGGGCGSDEATNDDDDDDGGRVIDAGRDSGTVRDSGSSSGASRLGRACRRDAECGSDGELFCLDASDVELLGGAFPKGVCTKECADDSECPSGGLCLGGLCFEGCQPGASGTTLQKCHNRAEVLCAPVQGSDQACRRDSDCELDGEVCLEGSCTPFACLPGCGSDADCATGLYCDYRSGFCVEEKPTGKEIGEPCDQNSPVNDCKGFCLAVDDTGKGFCSAYCNPAAPFSCGFTGQGKANAACLFVSIVAPEPEANDLAFCGQLCDCNSDCSVKDDLCAELGIPEVEAFWQRRGYCRPADSDFDEKDSLSECPDNGGGNGEGGAPGNGAGGAPGNGSGGAPGNGAGGDPSVPPVNGEGGGGAGN